MDENRDGKIDRLELTIQMPLSAEEQIYNFNVLIHCKVKFDSKVKYIFDAVSLISFDSALSLGRVTVEGDLWLRQLRLLNAKGGSVQ